MVSNDSLRNKSGVFISYARSDGSEYATWLRRKLQQENPDIPLWQDIISERSGRDWWLQITDALDRVAYMVIVATAESMKSDVVRKEWRYARQQGVCVLPVKASDALHFTSLPRWMKMQHFADLKVKAQWDVFVSDLRRPCQTPRVAFMADDLPKDFVARPRELEPIIHLLLDETREQRNPVAIATALRGAGGFGKTTLAKAVCHDERVQEAFDDGVLWVTLGAKVDNLPGKVAELTSILNGERTDFGSLDPAKSKLRDLLADRDILMVIDDVWDPAHLEPFLQGGRHCARLITTRNLDVLPPQCRDVKVDSLQTGEAAKLLGAGLPVDCRTQIIALAKRMGNWPLLLGIVKGVLQERVNRANQPPHEAIAYVNKALDKHGLTAFDTSNAQARNRAVALTVEVGLSYFSRDEPERQRFEELSISPEDVEIPLEVVGTLWAATSRLDEFDVEDLCVRLHRYSLLQTLNLETRHVRLHDVMRSYLQTAMAKHSDAKLVHGQLLDQWGDPHKLPDRYAWRWYAYHMIGANRKTDLRKLLLSPAWLQAKLAGSDVTSLTADFDYLPNDEDLSLVQGALRLSSNVIVKDPGQFASQIVGRLLPYRNMPAIAEFSKRTAEGAHAPWLRSTQPTLHPPGTGLLRTLAGHSHFVEAVAVTPDGRRAVSASRDHTLKVWDVASGRELRTLASHSNFVTAVAVTPDGQRAVSASDDQTLKVWDLASGRELRTLAGHSDGVSAVVVMPDGRRVVSASRDRTLKIWDLASGREPRTLAGHSSFVTAVAVTPDGQQAVSASYDQTLKVWDLASGRELRTLAGHLNVVSAVVVTPDGQRAVSASYDHTLKVWDLVSGRELRTLAGHSDLVRTVAVTPDGQRAVSASDDHNTLKVWDLASGRELRTLAGHSDGVSAVRVMPDGRRAVSASYDHTLKVWDLVSGRELRTPTGHLNAVSAVVVTPDGQRAVSASYDHTLKVWDLVSGRELRTLIGHSGDVMAVAVTPDGRRAVSASRDQALKVWDLVSGRELRTLTGHSGAVMAVAITPDGQRAVSVSSNRTLKMWDVASGRELRTLTGHSNVVNAVAVTPDGQRAVSASDDHTLNVWHLASGRELRTLAGHSGGVSAVVVMPDGRRAVSASDDQTLKVWELETGEVFATFTCDGAATCCAFSDVLELIVAGDAGGQLHFLHFEGN